SSLSLPPNPPVGVPVSASPWPGRSSNSTAGRSTWQTGPRAVPAPPSRFHQQTKPYHENQTHPRHRRRTQHHTHDEVEPQTLRCLLSAYTENHAGRALETARHFHPDFVFLDVMMPAIDGHLAAQLKSDPELKSLPL